MQHIRVFLLVIVFFSVFNGLKAASPPPINDTVCDAIDLGILPIPGACPTYPYGDTIHVSGTTDWATYNTLDFSPIHCFPNGSPDVWYHFRATGSFIYLEMTGSGDLDSFFVKLHYSQGSCLSLIPLTCGVTTNGFMQATFLTPEVGGEYFLQIGGSNYDETGNFSFYMKSFNECNGCVKNASLELTPAPWFGRYGTSDTVQMCVTVERWDQTTSSRLHSIVPVFGDEWDTTTLTPTIYPGPVANAQWMWAQNIPTPAGSLDGFYFDADSDGDPTNNTGEPGTVATTWTGCWSIATKPFCNSFDAFVEINIYSDDVTGSGNSIALCQEYWPIHMSLAGWCCPDPNVSVTATGVCSATSIILVDPVSGSSADSFNVILYDDSLHFVTWAQGITTGTATFNSIPQGDYLLEVGNTTNGCISFHQVHVDGPFEIDLTQTATGCSPGSGSVLATPVGGTSPFSYNWPTVPTAIDSLATGLNEGYVVVQVTDGMGCVVTDSLYVTMLTAPGAEFGYQDVSYCHNVDTIQVWYDPFTPGGIYQLISPAASVITVNPVTGTISLNGSTLATPYFIHVKYQVGSDCIATYIDSVQILQQPNTPLATSPSTVDWCIGSAVPTLSIQIGGGIPLWYDVQTTQSGIGNTMTPPLSSSTTPGQYLYGFVLLADLTGGCASLPAVFTVNAITPPNFLISSSDTICAGDTAVLFATTTGTYTYSWVPAPIGGVQNAQSTITSPTATTTYSCVVSDGACTSSQTLTIVVDQNPNCGIASDTLFHVYSGITPNNDGFNDAWIIDGVDNRTNVTVTIYNRWGKIVWKRNNYDNTTVVWRGEDNHGDQLPDGTYFYVVTQDYFPAETGWIELTR